MSVTDTSLATKAIFGKEATDDNKRLIEEFGAETINITLDEAWAVTPDPDPATAIADGYVDGYTLYALTEDTTVPSGQAWRAGGSTPSTTLRDWIPPDKFGPNYGVKIFDNNDNELSTAQQINAGMIWNDKLGILTVDSGHGFTTPFKITHHRYIGPKGVSSLITTPGGSDGQMQYNNGSNFDGAAQFYYDDANDRVGIGTDSPNEQLTLASSISVISMQTITDPDPSATFGYGKVYVSNGGELRYVDGLGNNTQITSSGDIAVSPGGSDGQIQYNNSSDFGGAAQFYYDDGNNRVGIGIASPDVMLHLQDSGSTPKIRIETTSLGEQAPLDNSSPGLELMADDIATAVKYTPAIKFGTSDDSISVNPYFGAMIAGEATEDYNPSNSSGMGIRFLTTPNASNPTNPSEVMFLDQDGNLLIGTSGTANEKLTVNGVLSLGEVSAPSQTPAYGKVFAGTDSELHYLDDSGNNVQITSGGSVNAGTGTVSNTDGFTGADGYVAFWTGDGEIAGDNDLFYDRSSGNLTLTGGGRLGIGAVSPAVSLEVVGNFSSTNTVEAVVVVERQTTGAPGNGLGAAIEFRGERSAGSVQGNTGQIQSILRDGAGGTSDVWDMAFTTRNDDIQVEGIRIKSDGSIGMGTTVPSARLDVTEGYLRARAGTNTPPSDGAGIELFYSDVNDRGHINSYDRDGSTRQPLRIDANPLALNTDATATFVGINETSPEALLEVSDGGSSSLNLVHLTNTSTSSTTNKTVRQTFRLTDTVGTKKEVGIVEGFPEDDNAVDAGLKFYTRNSNSPTHVMTMDSSQQVGIGTESPGNKLDISGNMVIGSGYAGGGEAAPTNSLMVENQLGVGTQPFDEVFYARRDGDKEDGGRFVNIDNGTSSAARVRLQAGGSQGHVLQGGEGNTGNFGGQNLADAFVLRGVAGTARMMVGTGTTGPLYLVTDNATAITIDTSQQMGIGAQIPIEPLTVDGNIAVVNGSITIQEQTAPSTRDGYGKVFTGTDSELHFLDDSGNNTQITSSGSVNASASGSDGQIQYNNNGSFGGASLLTWNDSTRQLAYLDDNTGSLPSNLLYLQSDRGDSNGMLIENTRNNANSIARLSLEGSTDGGSQGGSIEVRNSFTGDSFGGISAADSIAFLGDNTIFIHSTAGPVHINSNNSHAITVDTSQQVGIGTENPNEILTLNGALSLDEISAPSSTSGYGKLFTGTDSELHFLDDSGNNVQITSGGAVNAGSSAPVYTIDGSVRTSGFTASIDNVHRCDPSGGGFTITLPTASGNAGQTIIIKNTTNNTNTITIQGAGGQQIDGQANVTMTSGYESVMFVSYGSEWGRI